MSIKPSQHLHFPSNLAPPFLFPYIMSYTYLPIQPLGPLPKIPNILSINLSDPGPLLPSLHPLHPLAHPLPTLPLHCVPPTEIRHDTTR